MPLLGGCRSPLPKQCRHGCRVARVHVGNLLHHVLAVPREQGFAVLLVLVLDDAAARPFVWSIADCESIIDWRIAFAFAIEAFAAERLVGVMFGYSGSAVAGPAFPICPMRESRKFSSLIRCISLAGRQPAGCAAGVAAGVAVGPLNRLAAVTASADEVAKPERQNSPIPSCLPESRLVLGVLRRGLRRLRSWSNCRALRRSHLAAHLVDSGLHHLAGSLCRVASAAGG